MNAKALSKATQLVREISLDFEPTKENGWYSPLWDKLDEFYREEICDYTWDSMYKGDVGSIIKTSDVDGLREIALKVYDDIALTEILGKLHYARRYVSEIQRNKKMNESDYFSMTEIETRMDREIFYYELLNVACGEWEEDTE